jgi:hypothetical protein
MQPHATQPSTTPSWHRAQSTLPHVSAALLAQQVSCKLDGCSYKAKDAHIAQSSQVVDTLLGVTAAVALQAPKTAQHTAAFRHHMMSSRHTIIKLQNA